MVMDSSGQVISSRSSWKEEKSNSPTASSDDTVRLLVDSATPADSSPTTTNGRRPPKPITHPVAVRAILPLPLTDLAEPYLLTGAGDILRTFDISSLDEPELLSETDGHWHDITAIRLWIRKTVDEDGKTRVEPWVVTSGLDKTIRKWKLNGKSSLLIPQSKSIIS